MPVAEPAAPPTAVAVSLAADGILPGDSSWCVRTQGDRAVLLRLFAAGIVLLAASPAIAQEVLYQGSKRAGVVLPDGSTINGRSYDCYRLDAREGQLVTIDLEGHETIDGRKYDTYLEVARGGNCSSPAVFTDDDSGGDGNARLTVQIQSGPYIVRAMMNRPGDSGTYTLSAISSRPPAPIRPGEMIRGRWEAGDMGSDDDRYDCHAFDGTAGQTVLVNITGDSRNTGLSLHQGGGCGEDSKIAETERHFLSFRTSLGARLERSGQYSIRALGYISDSPSQYTLQFANISEANAAGAPFRLSGGDMVAGLLEVGDRAAEVGLFDCFVIQYASGKVIRAVLVAPEFPPGLLVHQGATCDGEVRNVAMIPEPGKIELSYRLPDAGAYSIRVRSASEAMGRYRLAATLE